MIELFTVLFTVLLIYGDQIQNEFQMILYGSQSKKS